MGRKGSKQSQGSDAQRWAQHPYVPPSPALAKGSLLLHPSLGTHRFWDGCWGRKAKVCTGPIAWKAEGFPLKAQPCCTVPPWGWDVARHHGAHQPPLLCFKFLSRVCSQKVGTCNYNRDNP